MGHADAEARAARRDAEVRTAGVDLRDPWVWALGIFGLGNLANAAWMLAIAWSGYPRSQRDGAAVARQHIPG